MQDFAFCQCGHSIQKHKTIVDKNRKLVRFCDKEKGCKCKLFQEYDDEKGTQKILQRIDYRPRPRPRDKDRKQYLRGI